MTQTVADPTDSTNSSPSERILSDPPDKHERRPRDPNESTKTKTLWVLLAGYMALLALNVSLPFVFVPLTADGAAAQVKDLMLAGSTVLQGLVSLLAIAVGYYFRESQEHG